MASDLALDRPQHVHLQPLPFASSLAIHQWQRGWAPWLKRTWVNAGRSVHLWSCGDTRLLRLHVINESNATALGTSPLELVLKKPTKRCLALAFSGNASAFVWGPRRFAACRDGGEMLALEEVTLGALERSRREEAHMAAIF